MKNKIDIILSSDHAEIDRLLEEAFVCLDSADDAGAFRVIDLFWARLAMHIRAEHLHLFPAVLKMAGSSDVIVIIDRLHADHDIFMKELAAVMKQIRGLGGVKLDLGDVRARLTRVRTLLEEHNLVEEEAVYNKGLLGLDPCEVERLAAAVQKEITNLPPRHAGGSPRHEPHS